MVRVHRLHFTSLNSINIQQNKTGQVSLLQQSKRNWRPGTGRHRSLVPHINSTSSSSYWCGVFCSAQQGMATDVCLNPLNVGMFFFYHSAITNVVTLHFGERVCSSHLLLCKWKPVGTQTELCEFVPINLGANSTSTARSIASKTLVINGRCRPIQNS